MAHPISLSHARMLALVALIILLLLIDGCGGGGNGGSAQVNMIPPVTSVDTPVRTDDGWDTATLGEVGIATQAILDAITEIRRGTYNEIHGFLVVKDGKLVVEEYGSGRMYERGSPDNFGPVINFDRDEPHILHSVSKSFMSTLVGIAIRDGYLLGQDQSVMDFFPEHYDVTKAGILLKHLMTMTSGLEWNEWDVPAMDFQNNDAIRYQTASDPSAYFFGKDLIHGPGTTFYYNTAGFQMMGEILRRATAMPLDRFADQQLFAPLGITNFAWDQYPHGTMYIVGDIFLRPRDMAKFGQLILNAGLWNGQQVVPADWLGMATDEFIPVAHTGYKGYQGYGFHWWRKNFRIGAQDVLAICADGLAGQSIMVFPELALVVVVTAGNYDRPEREHDLVTNHILPAVLN